MQLIENLIEKINKHIKYNESMIEKFPNNNTTMIYQIQKNTWENAKDEVKYLSNEFSINNSDNKDCSDCSRRKWYQIGFEDGKKEGLLEANKLIKQLLKEHQIRIDAILAHEGEEQ